MLLASNSWLACAADANSIASPTVTNVSVFILCLRISRFDCFHSIGLAFGSQSTRRMRQHRHQTGRDSQSLLFYCERDLLAFNDATLRLCSDSVTSKNYQRNRRARSSGWSTRFYLPCPSGTVASHRAGNSCHRQARFAIRDRTWAGKGVLE
jgi:hypothetical protein